jgi:hypothetical protein
VGGTGDRRRKCSSEEEATARVPQARPYRGAPPGPAHERETVVREAVNAMPVGGKQRSAVTHRGRRNLAG